MSLLTYASLLVMPALIYHRYGLWIGGFLAGQQGGRIQPDLLLTFRFWKRWAYLVMSRFGVVLPIAAVVGVVFARGRAR